MAIDLWLGLVAVLLLILVHGFFVAGEFAIVAVDRSALARHAREGDRRAASALEAVGTLSFQLSGAQLGITVTSLVVGFLVEPTLGAALEPVVARLGLPEGTAGAVAIGLALGLVTSTEMVVGELVPKNVAIADPLRVSRRVATPLRWSNRVLKGPIVFLNAAANWAVRRLGIEPKDELSSVHSLEELQMLVHSSRSEGVLPEEDFSLLSRSLTFGGKSAADALVPRTSVDALQAEATLDDLADLARETGHSRFPVYREDLDDVLGVAHVKDIYAVPVEARPHTAVTEATREAMVVPESRPLAVLLVEMRRDRQHLAIVADEYGGTAGVITLEDLLEEIVGEIDDEHDPSRTQLTAAPTGIHVVSGMLHPDEILELTGFSVPEGDYETLAGFLLTLFDRIPQGGDHTTYDGWELKVVEMERKRIAKVLLVAPSAASGEGNEGR
jgi:CBS domain containing-hemolysin-like protein